MLITGGAGFIGTHAASWFAKRGWHVMIIDNLSRRGADLNLAWLREECPKISYQPCDVRDAAAVDALFQKQTFDCVLHLAAQVAVTTSVASPLKDFEINAVGTFRILDAVRRYCPEAVFIFSSTNKVYGQLNSCAVEQRDGRYLYCEKLDGVDETSPLDFHSPYGCSKGAADQYVIDFARIYGLRSASFRQSCIYGERQFGIEDQGWVAWFGIAAVLGLPLTIFGDGRQVRDLLHVDDLVAAYELGFQHPEKIAGQAFNVGGGPVNSLSVLEVIELMEQALRRRIPLNFSDWRPGDQRVFISNIGKLSSCLGWTPKVECRTGVRRLISWVVENRKLIEKQINHQAIKSFPSGGLQPQT
jgi:CDP-paratose 2-epimerase